MSTKTDRYIFDWWVVEKRSIYLLIATLILCVLGISTALYVWKYGNPLKNVGSKVKMPDGARLISFEGDVRIIRAATRETIAPGSDTELYPGDTVQTQANGRARVSMAELIRLRIQMPAKAPGKRKAVADPLLKVAGICSGPVISANIDDELYGEGS